MDTSKERIAVIGLGYVGLPLAAEFGKVRPVLGFDVNLSRIEQLRAGVDRTLELNPAELESAKYLEFCHTPEELATCGVFIVTVPTPVDKVNQPDLKPLIAASQTVGKEMKQASVVIYESTMYSGCTEEVCVPILEAASGVVFNRDFFLRC